MWKLKSLRELIESAVPDLARDPEKLIVLANGGHVLSTLAGGLSFEYAYTIEITVLDFTGHTDSLFVPILAWLRAHQPEALDNPESRERAVEFNVEQLNSESADVAIRVPVTERVIVTADPDHPTRYNAEHPPEPCHPGRPCTAEHWQLFLKGELLAEWHIPVPEEQDRFGFV